MIFNMKRFLILLTIAFIWTCSSPTKSEPAPQPPTANNLSITTNEDTPTTFTMTGSDPEGAALTFSISTQPQNGTVTASGAAGTYTPNENFNGTDTFAYIASDGALSSTAGLVSVTVTAVDDDPNTMNVSAITDEDNAVEITLEAEEYDGDTISFKIKDNPTSGTVSLTGDKATYTPNANYYGSDSFTFEAVDYTAKKILNTATASITINPINDAPTASNVTADAYDNQSIDIDLPVEDVDEDNLSIQIIDNPSKITLSLNGSSVTIHNPNHYWGTDSFTYQAYDGTAYSDTKTVSLGMKRNVDYNISSHDYENYIMPWFDLAGITDGLGFSKNDSYNTNAAYADFNGDNYFDITIQPNVSDGASVETYFLTNNGVDSKITAGFISGIMESCLIYTPSEYLKIQAMKNNTLRMLKPKIYQNPKILFKGLLPTMVRTGTNQAVCFTFYDYFNEYFSSSLGHHSGKLVTGSLGAVTAVMVNNPIDVIKTKTQASNSSILSATKDIITNDGILGFWRGGLVRSTRMAPLYGLNFFLYDYFSGK